MPHPSNRYLAPVILLILALSALLSWAVSRIAPGSHPGLIFGNVLFALAALVHGSCLMGWKRILAFFSIACGLAFALEWLSLSTGLATPYHYTPVLGPCLGGVALVVPLGWFSMMYSSHCLVNCIAEGQALSTRGSSIWILLLSLLTALVLTAWDLTLDPFMVHRAHAWVWDQGGPYLGIPLANYVNWVEVSFIIAVACRFTDRTLASQPDAVPAPSMGRWWEAYPIAVYALVGLSDIAIGYPPATRVISPFAMGIPVLAGLAGLWQSRGGEG
jgi:putative membrane protein